MGRLSPSSSRGLRLLADALLLAWVVIWIWAGVRIAGEVRDLGRIGVTVARVGGAVADTGAALESFSGLPVLGDRIAQTGAPIREAGLQARESALQSSASARRLSTLLGMAIAVVPSLPLLVLYLPRRIAFERDRRAVRYALTAPGGDPRLAELLARRAAVHIPLHRLRAVSRRPVEDIAEGRVEALARAELERLGIDAPLRTPEPR